MTIPGRDPKNYPMTMKPDEPKRFFGKIMLLGEYSIIDGGEALAVPFERASGHLAFPSVNNQDKSLLKESNRNLKKFFSYLATRQKKQKLTHCLDLDKLENDLENGMFFSSNIPQGYGAGSSGALVAAVFHHYTRPLDWSSLSENDLQAIKAQLGIMESAFHGNSSGLDPLCSLLSKPLWVKTGQKISFPGLPFSSESFQYTVFLVDTGSAGHTRPLVDWYKQKVSSGQFNAELLMALNNQVIQALLKKDNLFFDSFMAQLSLFQLENMQPMIPEKIKSLWRQGVYSGEWMLKLCGSGGGGYTLGFTTDLDATIAQFSKSGLDILPVLGKQDFR